jgi:tRNA modification GTPase
MKTDTIFAPLTIKGKCSIYVIRISGSKTKECLNRLGIKKELKHREATLCTIKDNENNILDELLAIYFNSPDSFTGEDVCELNLHCSSYIINKVFEILSNIEDVRLAENGEFTKRAFLNNKLDLTQAESIVDLINSETKLQHRQAIEQLRGKNSRFFDRIRGDILDISSNLEVMIDFPEDEIDESIVKTVENNINVVINNIEEVLNDNKVGERIKNGLNISIIGEPNAGKSTFFNFLAKKDIAIVSNIVGTTRDVLEVSLDVDGIPVNFFDTAGIRNTKNLIEKEGVKRAIKNAENADLKILLMEPKNTNINENIRNLIDRDTIIVLNKVDLISDNEFNAVKLLYPDIIAISIKKNINMEHIVDCIKKYINKIITPYVGTNLTQERYRVELKNALDYLKSIDFSMPIEIISENIRSASFCIGKITGFISTDDILNNIFGKFCIGK